MLNDNIMVVLNLMRFSSEIRAPKSGESGDHAVLTEEYKQEINDLWETYAMRQARRQCLVGIVTSTKNAKSITVTVTRQKLIKKYRKWISRRKRFMAHDEEETANVGDLVRIVPCRPKSRKKRHMLMDILIAEGQLPNKHDHEKYISSIFNLLMCIRISKSKRRLRL
jgi:small subunit ribosomal protein S17